MVSSFPYPPQFLEYMRSVFADPEPFIQACLDAARAQGIAGFNIDWEPQTGESPTAKDASDYATFLGNFTFAMHDRAGLVVSVDVATWSPIWNIPLIDSASGLELTLLTMSTYTDNWVTWQKELAYFVSAVPSHQLVIGLETIRDSRLTMLSLTAQLKQRFDLSAA